MPEQEGVFDRVLGALRSLLSPVGQVSVPVESEVSSRPNITAYRAEWISDKKDESSSEYIKNKLGINTPEKLANFNNFFINLAIVESNNRNLPSSRGHNAAGFYQFLSNNGKAGGFIGSSLHGALNRLTTTYTKMNKKLPPRFNEIYKSKDVTRLSEADQKELVMADFYERKGTDPILKNIAAGDSESAFNLYRDIHLTSVGADQLTKRENNTQYEKVSELFKKNMRQLGQGNLIRSIFGGVKDKVEKFTQDLISPPNWSWSDGVSQPRLPDKPDHPGKRIAEILKSIPEGVPLPTPLDILRDSLLSRERGAEEHTITEKDVTLEELKIAAQLIRYKQELEQARLDGSLSPKTEKTIAEEGPANEVNYHIYKLMENQKDYLDAKGRKSDLNPTELVGGRIGQLFNPIGRVRTSFGKFKFEELPSGDMLLSDNHDFSERKRSKMPDDLSYLGKAYEDFRDYLPEVLPEGTGRDIRIVIPKEVFEAVPSLYSGVARHGGPELRLR
jgi:hypothetical protein